MFFYVSCAVFLWYTKLKVNGMLLKWKLSKLLSENKEANKELDEWMRKQVDEKKQQDDERKAEEIKKAAQKKSSFGAIPREWREEDDVTLEPFFVNRMAADIAPGERELYAPSNFMDRGEYIELVRPIGGIKMIEKICFGFLLSWKDAMLYAKTVLKGGFNDWRVPTKDEMITIYKIKEFCGINKCDDWFWTSTECDDFLNAYRVSLYGGHVSNGTKSGKYYVRCVR